MSPLILTNARIVTRDAVVLGTVVGEVWSAGERIY